MWSGCKRRLSQQLMGCRYKRGIAHKLPEVTVLPVMLEASCGRAVNNEGLVNASLM